MQSHQSSKTTKQKQAKLADQMDRLRRRLQRAIRILEDPDEPIPFAEAIAHRDEIKAKIARLEQDPDYRPSLPWGMGSAARHGRMWWLTYRDAEGKVRYENSGTPDASEAQRIMAQRALPRAQAMVATLEAIAHGEAHQSNAEAGASAARPKAGGRAPRVSRNRQGTGKGGTR